MATPNRKDRFSRERPGGGKASSAATQYHDSTTRTTCKSQKRRKFDETAMSTENADSVNDGQVARSHKTSRNMAGHRGKLKLMTEMPIDTLHEVFRQLDPVDLLHLSWASKTLRVLIMERSARYIWQEAFERLYASDNPPPPCPEDINITKYTRFLFNKKCMMCGIGNGYWTSWSMRLRTCSNCLVEHFTQCSFAPQYNNKLPSIGAKNHHHYFLKRDIKDAEENAYPADKLKNRLHDAVSFFAWEIRCLVHRKTELNSLRLEKKKAILQKLEEIGWKQSDIENIAGGKVPPHLPGLKTAKKLTNKDWQEIRPQILKYLGDLQEHHDFALKLRRSENRWIVFNQTFTTWKMGQTSHPSLVPHPADIAVLEPFRSTLFSSDAEMVEFDIDEIDRTAKEWMRRRDALIFSLLPKDIQDRYRVEDFQVSLHSLVILRFSGPQALTGTIDQICGSRQSASCSGDLQDPSEGEIGKLLAKHCRVVPWTWNSQDLSFDAKAFEIGKDTITFLGLDPYTTTFGDLMQCHRKFICFGKHPSGFISNKLIGVEILEHDCNLHEENWTPAAVRWKAV